MTNPSPKFLPGATHALTPSRDSFRTPPRLGWFPAFAIWARGAIIPRAAAGLIVAALLLPCIATAQETQTNSPSQLFAQALTQLVAIIQPPTNQAPRTFTTTVKVIKADGLPKEIEGRELDLAYQGPDHLRIGA